MEERGAGMEGVGLGGEETDGGRSMKSLREYTRDKGSSQR